MILSELREYLKQQKRVTLHTLVLHFQIEADALRGMLAKWIQKGKVQKISPNANCGTGCCQCDPTLTELYEWVGDKK
ncbi:MAG: FeoC-like transcriptional regulator [Methylococcales bacterium]|nr:FeoC-like transcriptional regulator [Methylococcales bacterium]